MRSRSMLFGPAQRIDYVPKFVASGADIGVLDLEDATPLSEKPAARIAIAEAAPGSGELGDMRLFVRINGLALDVLNEDLEAAAAAGAIGIVAPKAESTEDVIRVRDAMASAGLGDAELCAGIESVLGVHRSVEIATAGVDLVYFGAEDFISDIGGVRTRSNDEVHMARSQVAVAARIGNVTALDQVVVDFNDADRSAEEAASARALGYGGKLCIHPSQVSIANDAFTPSDAERTWAQGVLEAAATAEAEGRGVFVYEGEMVDLPIITRAQRIVAF